MIARPIAAILAGAAILAAATSTTRAADPSLRDKATYNQSVAALLGGISKVKAADSASLAAVGCYLEKLVTIEQDKEKLRAATMANDLKEAQDFYERRKLNAAYRKSRQSKPLNAGQLKKMAQRNSPVRLSSAHLVTRSSQVAWPFLLSGDSFRQDRAAIEKLMAERAEGQCGAGSVNCERIEQTVAQMKTTLKQRVREISPMDYLAAKKFLDGLAFEARFVAKPGLTAVASNN